MFASLLPLSTDNISLLHPVAGRCVFWELEPSAAHHVQNQGFSALEKEAWLSRMLLEYGPCGFNISCGIDDTPALATVLFGDERNLPGVENMPTAPVTNGADVISSLFVETGFECLGFEQLLIDAALPHQRAIAQVYCRGRSKTMRMPSTPPGPMRPLTSAAVIDLYNQPSFASSLRIFSSFLPAILPPSSPSRTSTTLYSIRSI